MGKRFRFELPYFFSHHTFSLYLIRTGNFNLFAIVCTVAFIIVTIIVLIVVLSVKRHSAKYYTNEDKRNGKSTFSHSHSTQKKTQLYPMVFFASRWTVREKHRYTFNHRKRIELQISHRWYYLHNWRSVIAAIMPTIDIVYNAERVNNRTTAAAAAATSTVEHRSICI